MSSQISVRLLLPPDLDILHTICREAYSQNFHHHWNGDGLALYLAEVFGRDLLAAELADAKIRYYAAFRDEKPVAFMKLDMAPDVPGGSSGMALEPGKRAFELDKLYILPECKGLGIGGMLVELAFELGRSAGMDFCQLAVIDTNAPAIAFYEKHGFRFYGTTRITYPLFKEELKGMWLMRAGLRG